MQKSDGGSLIRYIIHLHHLSCTNGFTKAAVRHNQLMTNEAEKEHTHTHTHTYIYTVGGSPENQSPLPHRGAWDTDEVVEIHPGMNGRGEKPQGVIQRGLQKQTT